MIYEILAVAILALGAGAGIMYLLIRFNKKFEQKIDRSEARKYAAMNDPELLLKKLNENGVMVDDGDEISFTIEVKDGKKQLVQKIKKNAVPAGVPNVTKVPKIKDPKKKEVKKGGEDGRKKESKKEK